MLGWLYSFFIGTFCKHKWVIHKEQDFTITYENGSERDYKKIISRCGNCGEMKQDEF